MLPSLRITVIANLFFTVVSRILLFISVKVVERRNLVIGDEEFVSL